VSEVTSYVVSRFYRPPEVILGAEVTCAVDMWSLGVTLLSVVFFNPFDFYLHYSASFTLAESCFQGRPMLRCYASSKKSEDGFRCGLSNEESFPRSTLISRAASSS